LKAKHGFLHEGTCEVIGDSETLKYQIKHRSYLVVLEMCCRTSNLAGCSKATAVALHRSTSNIKAVKEPTIRIALYAIAVPRPALAMLAKWIMIPFNVVVIVVDIKPGVSGDGTGPIRDSESTARWMGFTFDTWQGIAEGLRALSCHQLSRRS